MKTGILVCEQCGLALTMQRGCPGEPGTWLCVCCEIGPSCPHRGQLTGKKPEV